MFVVDPQTNKSSQKHPFPTQLSLPWYRARSGGDLRLCNPACSGHRGGSGNRGTIFMILARELGQLVELNKLSMFIKIWSDFCVFFFIMSKYSVVVVVVLVWSFWVEIFQFICSSLNTFSWSQTTNSLKKREKTGLCIKQWAHINRKEADQVLYSFRRKHNIENWNVWYFKHTHTGLW